MMFWNFGDDGLGLEEWISLGWLVDWDEGLEWIEIYVWRER